MTATRLPERAAPESIGFTRAGLDRLGAALYGQIERKRLPGAVALIVRQGRLAYFEALGRRDPAQPDPMRPDTLFRIYSMTKPVVSVAAMMLFEEGRLLLTDPVAKHLPEFKDVTVGVVRDDGQIDRVPAQRAMTLHDLLRHTAGFTYEILAHAPIRKLYARAKVYRRDWTNQAFSQAMAALPLMYQPGSVFDYSRATDVLGRVVEVVSGQPLREFFQQRIFGPLGMADTGFHVPASQHHRLAEPFATDPDTGAEVQLLDVHQPVAMDMGGGGLVSSAADYARFCQMLLNGGALDGHRLLSRKTVELMTSDHLGSIPSVSGLLPPGYGFGLGFAVRLQTGLAPNAGSQGLYYWGGMAGTTFFIDPKEEMFAVLMTQGPGQADEIRALFRNLVYAALGD
ncbi:MAG TPA: serine hydrolase domain-containing protein [Burkholderiaceae bacterium]|nr:serine hydrolase domain-containing protein [Burkholderiaceae bacterium]